jgi:arginyl-tRNA--protein-N-Asp/Glu arginylyltransferase
MTRAAKLSLDLYLSPEHACAYLPERLARLAFVDPDADMDARTYGGLAAKGFRRSGAHVYRPYCAGCQACVPLRVPVADFSPDRSQRRVWKQNRDLETRPLPAEFNTEHYFLYRRYLETRHPGGGMDDADEAGYRQFLLSPWGHTVLVEMRLAGTLAAVAVIDRMPDALSAVYTFYAPDLRRRSLGTYAVLWQIDEARRLGLRWVYLGYWIAASRKMAYKSRFRPYEQLVTTGWQRVD